MEEIDIRMDMEIFFSSSFFLFYERSSFINQFVHNKADCSGSHKKSYFLVDSPLRLSPPPRLIVNFFSSSDLFVLK